MPVLESKGEGFDRVHIPPKVYHATLAEVRDGEIPSFDNPETKQKVLFWAFTIQGKERAITVEGMTTTAFGEKSKARKWVKAMIGAEPGKAVDTDDLIGTKTQILVEDRTSKDGETYSRVAEVVPSVSTDEIPF